MSARKVVVLSSTIDGTYSFFAPLTALVWRRVTGFEPLLCLVGSEAEWRRDGRAQLALAEARRRGSLRAAAGRGSRSHVVAGRATVRRRARRRRRRLPAHERRRLVANRGGSLPGHRSIAIISRLQLRRLRHGGAFPDVPPRRRARCGARCSASVAASPPRIPWPPDADWHFDERFASAELRAWPAFGERCQLIPRAPGPSHGRLDRADWRFTGTVEGLIDAHLLRPGFTDDNWPRLYQLLSTLVDGDDLQAAAAYRARYAIERVALINPAELSLLR